MSAFDWVFLIALCVFNFVPQSTIFSSQIWTSFCTDKHTDLKSKSFFSSQIQTLLCTSKCTNCQLFFFQVKFRHLFTLTNVQSEFRHHFVLTNIQIENYFFSSQIQTLLCTSKCAKRQLFFFFQVRFRHTFALTNVQSGN